MKSLCGVSKIQADDRGRIRIPSSFRECFRNDEQLYCMATPGEKSLTIFGEETMNKISSQLRNSIIGDVANARKVRNLYRGIKCIEEDSQKRFTLTQSKDGKAFFEVEREMIFIGMSDKLELWRKSDYDRYEAECEMEEEMAVEQETTGQPVDRMIYNSEGKPTTW